METTTTLKRFNYDASTHEEAKNYILNRAKQLLRFGYSLTDINEYYWGVSAYFVKDKHSYQSIYILTNYRNKGKYKEIVTNQIITSFDCGIETYLLNNQISYAIVNFNRLEEYKIISKYYGDQTTKRTGVYLMNHIDEGLAILEWIGASELAKKAYCLHPIYQDDTDLYANSWKYHIHTYVMIRVMEYRSVANENLSLRTIHYPDEIRLSPLKDVNDMLIADKIQNRKDFELYHKDTHPRSKELTEYFNNWLTKLGVSEETYQQYKEKLS